MQREIRDSRSGFGIKEFGILEGSYGTERYPDYGGLGKRDDCAEYLSTVPHFINPTTGNSSANALVLVLYNSDQPSASEVGRVSY